jgi:hypothetical protein
VLASEADPEAAGRIVGVLVLVAVVLSLAVRSTERVTVTIAPSGDGSAALVSGCATPALRSYLADFAAVTVPRS